ncbi:MAG TPA: hypothetical protein VHE30_24490 [Polyangiaceae bacterium]|nr:hypothetical protein [Polyangiaceae bacterium]
MRWFVRPSVSAAASASVVPLDAMRRAALRVVVRHPRWSDVVLRRDLRIATLGVLHAAFAFVLAVYCPVLLLVLGPVLLGVVHVASDVRYLVVRRQVSVGVQRLAWGACGVLVLLRVVAPMGLASAVGRAEWVVATAWVVSAAALGGASGGGARLRSAGAVLLALALGTASILHPDTARLVFVQAHNVVALLLWFFLFRRNRRAVAVPLALTAALAVWLCSGRLYALTLHHGQATAFGVHVLAAADWLVPTVERADLAVGLTCAFVFLQSVHYAVWLLYVPQDDQRFEATPSFRASVRGLVRDFGPAWLAAIALAAVVVLALAAASPVKTRHTYLSLATFHGYLELALFAHLFARGRLPRDAR